MRSVAYFFCVVLVALSTFYASLVSLLSLFRPPSTFLLSVDMFLLFGSLVPPILANWLPRSAVSVLGYLMLFLATRRTWLFIVRKERTPVSFGAFQNLLALIGLAFFALGWGTMIFGASVSSGFTAAILFIPAMVCIPWAFFLTEIFSFRRGPIKSAA